MVHFESERACNAPNIGSQTMHREGQDNRRKQETGDTTGTLELFIQRRRGLCKRKLAAHVLLKIEEDELTQMYTWIRHIS